MTQLKTEVKIEIKKETWKVYILLANDGRLYTGITTNMVQRWRKHCAKKGAKFFNGRRPITLIYMEGEHTRSSASQREYKIKQLSRLEKWLLILNHYGPPTANKIKNGY